MGDERTGMKEGEGKGGKNKKSEHGRSRRKLEGHDAAPNVLVREAVRIFDIYY